MSLVDSEGESEANGELTTTPREWRLCRGFVVSKCDAWQEDGTIVETKVVGGDATVKNAVIGMDLVDDEACTIAKTTGRANIAEEDNSSSGFEKEVVWGCTRGIECVEELGWKDVVFGFEFGAVCGSNGSDVPGEAIEALRVKGIDRCVERSEDGAFPNPRRIVVVGGEIRKCEVDCSFEVARRAHVVGKIDGIGSIVNMFEIALAEVTEPIGVGFMLRTGTTKSHANVLGEGESMEVFQRGDFLRDALTMEARLPSVTMGRTWRKSPPRMTVQPAGNATHPYCLGYI